jgi:hypothetical protein
LPDPALGFNMGKHRAMEGDSVVCPSCNTTGYIVCDGPRHRVTHMGKRPALNNDLCKCACDPAPRLINSLTNAFENLGSDGIAGRGIGSRTGPHTQTTSHPSVGRRFRFVASVNKQPLSNRDYIATVDGESLMGVTDGAGYADVEALPGRDIRVHLVFRSPKAILKHREI